MIRVVLVEDELLVRLGLKTVLEESGLPIQVAGAFATAAEALAFFDEETADVLVTDIRLPGMSGLEMISVLDAAHSPMRKVVLSCFEDFNYAREAYELGVDRYILKHELDEEELPALVRQLAETTETAAGGRSPGMRSTDEKAVCLLAGVALLRGGAVAGESDLDLNMVSAALAQVRGPLLVQRVTPPDEASLAFLLCYPADVNDAALQVEARHFFDGARGLLANFIDHALFIAFSPPFTGDDGRLAAEAELRRMMPAAFYSERADLLFPSEHLGFNTHCEPICWEPAALFGLEEDRRAFAAYLAAFFAHCRAAGVLPDAVRVQAAAFLHELDGYLRKHYGCALADASPNPAMPPNYLGVQRAGGCDALCTWLLAQVESAAAHVRERRENQSAMAGVLEFLQQNFDRDITLESLSATFHISPAYLSSLFRKKTGQTFTRYLGDLRVQRAKQLLEESDLSIEQVALRCGFQNSNYFFRLFKKLTGQTAGEYRRLTQIPKT